MKPKQQKKEKKPSKKKPCKNYKEIFNMGFIFVGVGVVFLASVNTGLGAAFIGLGTIYMLLGAKNKDKWQK